MKQNNTFIWSLCQRRDQQSFRDITNCWHSCALKTFYDGSISMWQHGIDMLSAVLISESLVWYWSCLQYKDSIMEATTHCRENASIFDVSHMCGLTLKVRAQQLQSIILSAYAIFTVLGWRKIMWGWEQTNMKVILDSWPIWEHN